MRRDQRFAIAARDFGQAPQPHKLQPPAKPLSAYGLTIVDCPPAHGRVTRERCLKCYQLANGPANAKPLDQENRAWVRLRGKGCEVGKGRAGG